MGDLRFAVLGPLRVDKAGMPVTLGPRLAQLLSLLLLEPGRAIPAARLIDLLWGATAPESAGATLRSHVSHLRRALAPAGVLATTGRGASLGYRLDVDPASVDAHRFEAACEEAQGLLGDGEAARALALLDEALGLWRGAAHADLADHPIALPRIARLDGLRAAAQRARATALSTVGREAEAADVLRQLVAAQPYDESVRRQLVLALYAQDRVEEAAGVCRDGLDLLRDRGVDSPDLHELLRLVLRRDLPVAAADAPGGGDEVAHMLPHQPRVLVGRDAALAAAEARLRNATGGPEVLLVTGPAGVGKTSFAVLLAHRVADHYPDGQLYVNLRGSDPAGAPVDPAEALHGFLDALGVPPDRIPATVDGRAARFRSRLARRHVLVVLDNARDADQVRDLVPGSAGCGVIVTSRARLAGLVTTVSAHPVPLDLLPKPLAAELFRARVGRSDVDDEAVGAIVDRCAGLPLALAIVAARAATRPQVPLRVLAAELSGAPETLDALVGADESTDLRAVFSWSYRALEPAAQRLFRMLALFPGEALSVAAAASLVGCAPEAARRALAELADAHMLAELPDGRYGAHDLLRAYAVELSAGDPAALREEAERRLVDHFLHTADAADRLLWPHRHRDPLDAPATGVTVPALADQEHAMAWFAAEQPVLFTLLARVPALAWPLTTYLHRSLQPEAVIRAMAAVEHAADPRWRAEALREIGVARSQLNQPASAATALRAALALFAAEGDRVGLANTRLALGWLADAQGHRVESLAHDRAALALFEQLGDRAGQARALNAVGWDHACLGDHTEALRHCRRALRLHAELGDLSGAARTRDSIGFALHHLGRYADALRNFEKALAFYRRAGDRYCTAETLTHVGDTLYASGSPAEACEAWREALEILDHLDHRYADDLRARLEHVDPRVA